MSLDQEFELIRRVPIFSTTDPAMQKLLAFSSDRLTYEAVIYRDFPLLQAVIILKSILILTINLGVDILYAYVDPRIRMA